MPIIAKGYPCHILKSSKRIIYSEMTHEFSLFFSLFPGALPFVIASVFCMNGFIKWLTIISYCIFCIFGLQKALTAASPWQRRLCFALPFLVRAILTILRVSKSAGGNPTAMTHVFLQVISYFFVAFQKDLWQSLACVLNIIDV